MYIFVFVCSLGIESFSWLSYSWHLFQIYNIMIQYLYESRESVSHWCLTLRNPMYCSLPGSSVHGILQATILDWVAIPFSRGSSWPRNQTGVSCIADRFFTKWATREVHCTSITTVLVFIIIHSQSPPKASPYPLAVTSCCFLSASPSNH